MEGQINNRYPSKPITIRGTTYPSQQAAAEALGVSFHAVHIAKKRGRLDFLGIGRGGLQSALQELISENAKLRADLAKAVEALEDASQIISQCTWPTMKVSGQYVDRIEVVQSFRTTLADLKG